MNYPQAIKYLDGFVNYEKCGYSFSSYNFKLQRLYRLLGLLGNPHRELKFIHVSGTKGKGSTCAYLSSILKEANFRVGLYTSPHLTDVRERIRILDKNQSVYTPEKNSLYPDSISRGDFCLAVERLKPALETLPEKHDYSFFELLTVAAFLYFNI